MTPTAAKATLGHTFRRVRLISLHASRYDAGACRVNVPLGALPLQTAGGRRIKFSAAFFVIASGIFSRSHSEYFYFHLRL